MMRYNFTTFILCYSFSARIEVFSKVLRLKKLKTGTLIFFSEDPADPGKIGLKNLTNWLKLFSWSVFCFIRLDMNEVSFQIEMNGELVHVRFLLEFVRSEIKADDIVLLESQVKICCSLFIIYRQPEDYLL